MQYRTSGSLTASLLLLAFACNADAETMVRYVHTDSLGSVVALTDQNRVVVERREFEPFGLQLSPSMADGPGYTGHVQDAATGLTYMEQRYYEPALGRFLSVDPVVANSSTGANFNRYHYANNSPYRFTDPDGRWPSDHGYLVHQASIERVIGPKVSASDLAVIQRAQLIADAKMHQTGASSFRHAMRDEGQSVADAKRQANRFVRERFESAWRQSSREDALIQFGIALHTLQDATSPAHEGFQEWGDAPGVRATATHIHTELFDPGEGSQLDRVTLAAWEAFENKSLPKGDLFGAGFKGVFRVEGRLDSRRLDEAFRK